MHSRIGARGRVRPLSHVVFGIGLALSTLAGMPAAQSGQSAPDASAAPSGAMRVLALYRADLEDRYRAGIESAAAAAVEAGRVRVEYLPYGDEDSAFDVLEQVFEARSHDVVLGPTDSGVFLRARKELDDVDDGGDVAQRPKPLVVSPLVTAPFEFDAQSSFFTVNVRLSRRSQVIADLLAKYWLRSVVVLHADTQFGQQAEVAFRQAYQTLRPQADYRSLQYADLTFDPRSQVAEVLKTRPEAVGVFATREQTSEICSLIEQMNHSVTPYRPILFTPIDHRSNELHGTGLHIVSLAPAGEDRDDVSDLAHATIAMLLAQLEDGPFAEQQAGFRSRLVDVFRGTRRGTSVGPEAAGPSELRFARGRNQGRLYVSSVDDGGVVTAVPNPTAIGRLGLKVQLLWRTVGYWPLVNLAIVLLIPLVFGVLDLKRWWTGKLSTLLFSPYSILFIGFNVFIVLVLYVYLAETGRVPWDSTITAIVVGIGPTTFMRSTIFNTPAGKAIGLGTYYDKFTRWINEQLMITRFKRQQKLVNIVAYFNSLGSMKHELRQLYSNSPDPELRARLTESFEEELAKAESHVHRRRICARRMLGRFEWGELKSRWFVPEEYHEGALVDPDEVIKKATRYVRSHREIRTRLEELAKQVAVDYADAKLPQEREQNREYHWMRLLVEYGFYTPSRLGKEGLLPPPEPPPVTRAAPRASGPTRPVASA